MNQLNEEENVREHTYDGIREFDKSMPNWWLFTLYATIAFAIAYWVYFQKSNMGMTQEQEFEAAMDRVGEAVAKAKAESGVIDDDTFWVMAKNPELVGVGEQIYLQTCSACHGASLEGGIGLALNDDVWKHGGNPLEIKKVVEEGVSTAGMPPWGPILGDEKINQVVSFLLSHHRK